MSTVSSAVSDHFEPVSFEESKKNTENNTYACQMIKVAAVVGVIFSAIVFVILPKLLTLCLFLSAGYACFEAVTIATNVQKIYGFNLKEIYAHLNEKKFLTEATQNTYLARTVLWLTKMI